MKNILIIGSGFAGAVIAREIVNKYANISVEIWDERSHVAGNCHTEVDKKTGIVVHKYGPHIFNTNNVNVWNYVNKYSKFNSFTNRVKAVTDKGIFSMPINLLTINQFFNKNFNPKQAKLFFDSISAKNNRASNFEEQALNLIGEDLYNNFFKGYTIKQWGCHPRELPASILKRLPIRFNYDDNYYDKIYQGIPENGYTDLIKNILNHKRINISLGKKFKMQDYKNSHNFSHIYFSGPIDQFFEYKFGMLGYRTVFFKQIKTDLEDFQGNAVINYNSENVPYTRIHEHKHFNPNLKSKGTVVFKEFSKETSKKDIPYYPKRLAGDMVLFEKYKREAISLNENKDKLDPSISFIGRLGTYRYLDMEKVISESLNFSKISIKCMDSGNSIPTFVDKEKN